jgi:photosystem II stability/assembly factor-like uncharacterized protein
VKNDQWGHDPVIAADPSSASVVYFGGTPMYKSVDGGATWSNIQSAGGNSIHVDQHVLTFDMSGRLYVGNDGGIWRTPDAAESWTNLNGNLAITQFYPGFSAHPTNAGIAN